LRSRRPCVRFNSRAAGFPTVTFPTARRAPESAA
jgi:hypothetical protein